MKKLPIILIYSRLVFAVVILIAALLYVHYFTPLAVTLLVAGLLSDVFDGIIARKYNVSTQKLRRLDSTVDQVFFISFAIAAYFHCPLFFTEHAFKLILLFAVEIATYVISFIKFRKEIATHSIGAKLWTLLLVATLIQIIVQCTDVALFEWCFWVGIVTRLEIVAIIVTLKSWTNDVPSLYHAIQLRNGKAIRRNKLFNG